MCMRHKPSRKYLTPGATADAPSNQRSQLGLNIELYYIRHSTDVCVTSTAFNDSLISSETVERER